MSLTICLIDSKEWSFLEEALDNQPMYTNSDEGQK